MNGENYYFQTGFSRIIYKIYRLVTALFIISQNSKNIGSHQRSSFADDLLIEPEYQDLIKDNIWNRKS